MLGPFTDEFDRWTDPIKAIIGSCNLLSRKKGTQSNI